MCIAIHKFQSRQLGEHLLQDYCENGKGIFDLVPLVATRGIDFAATVTQIQFQLLDKYNSNCHEYDSNFCH